MAGCGQPEGEHRREGVGGHGFGDAGVQQAAQAGAAVGGDDQQVGLHLPGIRRDARNGAVVYKNGGVRVLQAMPRRKCQNARLRRAGGAFLIHH